MGTQRCKELREVRLVRWFNTAAAELVTLGSLGSVLPAPETLLPVKMSAGAVVPDGVQQLEAGLSAGVLPSITSCDRVFSAVPAVCTRATQEPRRAGNQAGDAGEVLEDPRASSRRCTYTI